jgi:hypothetical protein
MAAFGQGFTAKHVGTSTHIFNHEGEHIGTLHAQHHFTTDDEGNLILHHAQHGLRRMTTDVRTTDLLGVGMDHGEHREQLRRCNARNQEFWERVS